MELWTRAWDEVAKQKLDVGERKKEVEEKKWKKVKVYGRMEKDNVQVDM